jgi:hypothetical protein
MTTQTETTRPRRTDALGWIAFALFAAFVVWFQWPAIQSRMSATQSPAVVRSAAPAAPAQTRPAAPRAAVEAAPAVAPVIVPTAVPVPPQPTSEAQAAPINAIAEPAYAPAKESEVLNKMAAPLDVPAAPPVGGTHDATNAGAGVGTGLAGLLNGD